MAIYQMKERCVSRLIETKSNVKAQRINSSKLARDITFFNPFLAQENYRYRGNVV